MPHTREMQADKAALIGDEEPADEGGDDELDLGDDEGEDEEELEL